MQDLTPFLDPFPPMTPFPPRNPLALGALPELRTALETRSHHPSAVVREHVAWALARRPGNP